MGEIKFRFYHQHGETARITSREHTLEEIEDQDSWQGATPWARIATCQYTGLKDMSGVDIYEGDIVRSLVDGDDWEFANFEVGFDAPQFTLRNGGRPELSVSGYWQGDEYEVIGNVYESPELLKDVA